MADKRDFYEVLGVSKSSTAKEIKSAFKKLAKKYHPDISKEENAEEKFKEIQEAYAVLSDENKRAQYDQFGHAAFDQMGGGSGFEGFDFSDIFSDIFGGGFGSGFGGFGSSTRQDPNGPRPGRDMEISVTLTFKEAIFGVEKEYSIKRDQDCKSCNGTGAKNANDVKVCSTCSGVGRVRQQQKTILGMAVTEVVCPSCHGKGKEIKNPCNECRGKGRASYKEDIKIKIPAGADNGSYLKVTSKGEGGYNGGRNGDLFLYINVKEDEFFQRNDLDIHITIPISYSQAALGDTIDIPTIHGEVSLKIPQGTQSGSMLKLKNQGIKTENPSMFGKNSGDQIVKVNVVVPTNLNSKEKELLKKLSEYDDKHTSQKGFFDKIKDIFH